ncbi:hypothetical protein O3G_MSEX000781 [Manduca sexta]|nr:hypothetical protein O3G_MSEX000781 [Manduca sexta]KAG6439446.1 hypothetical protein O3G_MSEX000781 [Manduca sexta]
MRQGSSQRCCCELHAGFSTITALMSRHHSTRYNSSTEVFLMWRYPIPCFCITTLHYLLYI